MRRCMRTRRLSLISACITDRTTACVNEYSLADPSWTSAARAAASSASSVESSFRSQARATTRTSKVKPATAAIRRISTTSGARRATRVCTVAAMLSGSFPSGRGLWAACEMADQRERRLGRPMQIVDDHDELLLAGRLCQPGADAVEQAVLLNVGMRGGDRLKAADLLSQLRCQPH